MRSIREVSLDVLTAQVRVNAGRGEQVLTREEIAHAAAGPGTIGEELRRTLDAIGRVIQQDRDDARAEVLGAAIVKDVANGKV